MNQKLPDITTDFSYMRKAILNVSFIFFVGKLPSGEFIQQPEELFGSEHSRLLDIYENRIAYKRHAKGHSIVYLYDPVERRIIQKIVAPASKFLSFQKGMFSENGKYFTIEAYDGEGRALLYVLREPLFPSEALVPVNIPQVLINIIASYYDPERYEFYKLFIPRQNPLEYPTYTYNAQDDTIIACDSERNYKLGPLYKKTDNISTKPLAGIINCQGEVTIPFSSKWITEENATSENGRWIAYRNKQKKYLNLFDAASGKRIKKAFSLPQDTMRLQRISNTGSRVLVKTADTRTWYLLGRTTSMSSPYYCHGGKIESFGFAGDTVGLAYIGRYPKETIVGFVQFAPQLKASDLSASSLTVHPLSENFKLENVEKAAPAPLTLPVPSKIEDLS